MHGQEPGETQPMVTHSHTNGAFWSDCGLMYALSVLDANKKNV